MLLYPLVHSLYTEAAASSIEISLRASVFCFFFGASAFLLLAFFANFSFSDLLLVLKLGNWSGPGKY